jgi:WD40 repeat protein
MFKIFNDDAIQKLITYKYHFCISALPHKRDVEMRKSRLSPSRTVVTNFGRALVVDPIPYDVRFPYDETIWVLDVAASDEWISCGLSNGDVNIYDRARLNITRTYPKLHGKGCTMTDLTTSGSNLVATSSANGQCCILDVRQPIPALTFTLPRREEALSVSLGYDGVMAAVGSNKPLIHLHDIRQNGSLLGTYQDAHTDEVTRVRFQSPQSPLLVSASEDGLACIFDTSKPSEEAALKSVLNVQTPLRKVGFFGPSLEGIYCLTGSETLSVWHHESAQRICDFGVDVRDKLSTLAEGAPVDYLVDCRWDVSRQELSLVAGNHAGDACMYRVDAGSLSLSHFLQGGHRGDIRSWCHLSNSSIFVTAGEDARMCEWNRLGSATTAGKVGGVAHLPRTHGSGPLRRPKKKENVTPY